MTAKQTKTGGAPGPGVGQGSSLTLVEEDCMEKAGFGDLPE